MFSLLTLSNRSLKNPDLIDFFIVKGLTTNYITTKNIIDLSSDHIPVLLTFGAIVIRKGQRTLTNRNTDLDNFQKHLHDQRKVRLKSPDGLDFLFSNFTESIREAARRLATPIPEEMK